MVFEQILERYENLWLVVDHEDAGRAAAAST
jgi:hypothetical protein